MITQGTLHKTSRATIWVFFCTIQPIFPHGSFHNLPVKNTSIPFDTAVSIQNNWNNQGSLAILLERYSKVIFLQLQPHPAICPVYGYCDFDLPKEPKDSLPHLIQFDIDEMCIQRDTLYHISGFQYLLTVDSKKLYMKVKSIKNQFCNLQFDTVSFLNRTLVAPQDPLHQILREYPK